MFDKLFDFLKEIWNELKPYYIVTEMELACVLRFGVFHHISKPGIHLKLPFSDMIYSYHVKTQSTHLFSQTLTTSDNKSIVVKAIVRYNIFDIKKYVIEVWDAHNIISDTVYGIVSDIIKKYTWDEILKGVENEATEISNKILNKWGIEIEKITLSDLGIIRTIRLINQ